MRLCYDMYKVMHICVDAMTDTQDLLAQSCVAGGATEISSSRSSKRSRVELKIHLRMHPVKLGRTSQIVGSSFF